MGDTVRKLFCIDRAVSPPTDEMATFVASTNASDRYGDVVDQSWILDNYTLNPVIQRDHDYRTAATVGRGEKVRVENGKLIVDIKWGTDPASKEIAQKVKEGLINAVSVGFRPGRSILRSGLPTDHPYYADPKDNPYGRAYYDNDLYEISVVAIPANPEALAQRSVGLSDEQLEQITNSVFSRLAKATELSTPRKTENPSDKLAEWLAGGK